MDDWEIIADNGNTSKSKLERTLGQGADSAHVALNAEYRKRYESGHQNIRVCDSDAVSSDPETRLISEETAKREHQNLLMFRC